MFPPDHHDVAHADAAEQDEQLRLLFRVRLAVPACGQRKGHLSGSSLPSCR